MLIKRENRIIVKCNPPILVIALAKGNKVFGNMNCVIKEGKVITISDIDCAKNDKGYGSLMMKKLIEVANEMQYDYINGWLSKEDIGHKDRLFHFYRKFGFEIILHDEGIKFADIRLTL